MNNQAIAYQVGEKIDLDTVAKSLPGKVIYRDTNEIFISEGTDKYILLFNYGVVSFFGYMTEEIFAQLSNLTLFFKNTFPSLLKEEIQVSVNQEEVIIGYNEIGIKAPEPEAIHVILFNVCQSVALHSCSQISQQLLADTQSHTIQLEQTGRIRISGTNLKKYIGKTLNMKNSIAQNLYIFESPSIAWENEYISRIDLGLKKIFEINLRYRSVSEDLQIVKENLDLFKDLLQHRQSSVLEVVVILLIFLEVLDMILTRLL